MEPNNNVYYNPQAQYPQQPFVPQPYVPIKKVYKPFKKMDTVFVFITLIVACITVDFVAFHGFYIGFTIAYYTLFAATTAYIRTKDAVKNIFSLLCGGLSLAGALTFTLFDNMLINAIMFFLVMGLYCFYVLGISDRFVRPRGSFKSLIDLFLSVVVDTFGGLGEVFGSAKVTGKKNKKLISVLVGIAISIPFLLVIIPLLVKSDAAFEALIKKIAMNIGIYLVELGIALVATPFLFSYLFTKRHQNKDEKVRPFDKTRVLSPTVSISFLSVISLTYIVYLMSQLAYFFSAFRGILPSDYHYTASAFARRGFYEMFAVCVINVLIVSGVGILTKRINGKVSNSIKALSLFVTLFSVLLIVIAMQKMRLCISIYGLSVNRVLVSTLMIMVLIMIAFFILHIFAPKVNYLQPIIIICSAMFVALSFANIDARCAEYNINAYQSGKLEMLDTVAIREFSESAIPCLIDLAKGEDKVSANNAKNQLALYVENNDDLSFNKSMDTINVKKGLDDFRKYNKARADAYNMLKDYYNNLGDNEKQPMKDIGKLYRDGYYDDEGNFFIEFTDKAYSIKHSYNPKTGLYDKIEKTTEW